MIIQIADGSKWKSSRNAYIAFEVDDSGSYADLPNRKLSTYAGIAQVEDRGDYWEIYLKRKCNQDYPAGTKVREHIVRGSLYLPPPIPKG
ncbi:hypothetical protein ACFLQR_01180 [Verrucomicrobiota bacterium]